MDRHTPAAGSTLNDVLERAIGTASLVGDRALAWVSNAIERRFAGSKAPGTTWLFAADWLSTRSD